MTEVGNHIVWKRRFENLKADIQEVHEKCTWGRYEEDEPDEPISESNEYFISNSLEVVDNEEYAIEHWGKGKYFKVVRVRE